MPRKQGKRKTLNTGKHGWALALEHAQLALYKNRARKSQILQAMQFFEEQIKNNSPFPIESEISKTR
jgi:hypothetical protein